MIEEIILILRKYLKLSEEDAIIAALCAAGGFTADALFFPAGIPPGIVTLLSGAGGLLGSRLLKNRTFYHNFLLRKIDKLVSQKHLSKKAGDAYKKQLIRDWMKSISPPEKADDEM